MTLATPEQIDAVLNASPVVAAADAQIDAALNGEAKPSPEQADALLDDGLAAVATALLTAEVSDEERIGLVAGAIRDAMALSEDERDAAYADGVAKAYKASNDQACRSILAIVNKFPGQRVTLGFEDFEFVESGQYELGTEPGEGPLDLTYYVTVPHTDESD